MSIQYQKPTWQNNTGAAINAERLQAISNVLDALVNQNGNKAIIGIKFLNDDMIVTFADGTIDRALNPIKGEKGEKGDRGELGDSITATSTKTDITTTVDIKNERTGEVLNSFEVKDGENYVLTESDKEEIAEYVGTGANLMKFFVDDNGDLWLKTMGIPLGEWFIDDEGYLCVRY